nr:hypothetical protein [uncultured Clostridium sp.]
MTGVQTCALPIYVMKWLFWSNVICSMVACIVKNDSIINILIVVQIIVSILYVLLSILDDNFFRYNAEQIRRQAAMENGFGIDIMEYKKEGYYNNTIPNNIVKFSVNAFEIIMFSKTTAERMILKEGARTLIVFIAFIFACLVYKDYGVILIISQKVFSAYFIEEFVRLCVYKSKLEKLYYSFYKELITIGIKNEKQRSLLLAYAIEY